MDIEAPFIILIALAIAAALIYVWYLICREFSLIASEKGWNDRRYFHFCFWLGLVGILMVIALPDRGDNDASAPQPRPAAGPSPVAAPHSPSGQPATLPTASTYERKPTPEFPAAEPGLGAQQKPVFSTKLSKAADAPKSAAPANWTCRCGQQNTSATFLCSGCRALWHCTCGKLNGRQERKCPACGAWHCACGMLNPASHGSCGSCGEQKPR